MKTTPIVIGLAALVLAGGGVWWWKSKADTQTPIYRTAKIERGGLQASVSASGAVNPVTQVSVGTQVSGQIKELFVDFNSEVKAGQVIAQIDPETFEFRVQQLRADVDAASAAVLAAQANVVASQAAVSRVQVEVAEAQRDFERKKDLADKQFIAPSEADRAKAGVNTLAESLKSAQAQLAVTQAQVKSAQATVVQREAALAQAKIDLQRTRIMSPVHGIVIKRAIERGQTVAASLQAPELFVIAKNLSDMQVDASIDEADVSRVRMGQRASFTVDAFAGQTFEGEVRQVRKAAQTVANVVTYVAVVGFTNVNERLLPGMTANVRVIIDQREDVLKVPNAALRVRIAGVEPAASESVSALPPSGFGFLSQALAQPSAGPGGGMTAMRERLVQELGLSTEQQGKLDAIRADMQPQFMALRELDESQRRSAREKLMEHMRGKIAAMLNPDQRKKYADMLANAPAPQSSGAAAPQRNPEPSPAPSAAVAGNPPRDGAAPGSGGGPLPEFRSRLVSDLQLSAAQHNKLDSLIAEARPKFAAMRNAPPEERLKIRDRILSELRAKINDFLLPGQKANYAAVLAGMASRSSSRGRIYMLNEQGKPVAHSVRLGITDGTSTELIIAPGSPLADVLKEGVPVIVGVSGGAAPASANRPGSGPRMPF